MNTSDKISDKHSKYPFDRLIFEKKLRAKKLLIDKQLNLLVIIFNNGKLLNMRLSDYPKLKKASAKKLSEWKLIGGGIGIRWESLDEDLSIKGAIKAAALAQALRDLQGYDDVGKNVA